MLKKILHVDLSKREYNTLNLDSKVLFEYLGGLGLGVYYLYRNVTPAINPFSPLASLILLCGPLSSQSISWRRYGLFFKSPLTGIIGESYSYGLISETLSALGYMGLIVKGYAEKPTWLLISENGVNFNDASGLWGVDAPSTCKEISKQVKSRNLGVLSIGPAGENLVRYASIIVDGKYMAPRCGGGAVMGSKNLKSIAIDAPVIEREENSEMEKIEEQITESIKTAQMRKDQFALTGDLALVDIANQIGVFPTKYWRYSYSEEYLKFNASKIASTILEEREGCGNCPIKCRYICRDPGGKAGDKYHLTYETVNAFGGLCGLDDSERIAKMNGLCFRLGVDPASLSNMIGFAIELVSKNKLKPVDKLEYGELEDLMRLTEQICYRDQFGFYFSDGLRIAAKKINYNDTLIEVKGLEPIGLDPRGLVMQPLIIGVSPSGGNYGSTSIFIEELLNNQGKRERTPKISDIIALVDKICLVNSLMVCDILSTYINLQQLSEILSISLNIHYGEDTLKKVCEKIINVSRHFLLREGLRSSDDLLPELFYEQPIVIGASKGKVMDFDIYKKNLEEYYFRRGFSKEGVPHKKSELDDEGVTYYF
ncbi:MAG: aldehyde ferredoxin oxidoreductase C-terminal domain-containing protein [Candidatus Odinarchaeota archaeon]